jgi:protein TonB
MFSGLPVAQEPAARRWTTLTSFTLQAALVAAALVLPLLHPENLPEAFVNRRTFVPASNVEAPKPPTRSTAKDPVGRLHLQPLIVNRNISFHPVRPQEEATELAPPGPLLAVGPAVPGVPYPALSDYARTVLHHVTVRPRRQSVVMEGNLVHRVEPQYPMTAKQLHIQGVVILKAVISREGRIEQAETVQGQDLLSRAALAAVRQWKYRPYYLNGEPVEVETKITVSFVLER